MRRIGFHYSWVLPLAFVSTPIWAQDGRSAEKTRADRWSGALELTVAPRFGKPLSISSDTDLVDESEGDLNVQVTRASDRGFTRFQMKAGVTASPQLLDDSAASSSVYAEATLGDTYIPFGELEERLGGAAMSDAVRPYARYRFTSAHREFIGGRLRDDHRLTGGVRYRNIRSIMTRSLSPGNKPVMGWYWEGRLEASKIFSTDPTKRRIAPTARLDVFSRPIGLVRVFGRAQGEISWFDDARVANGDKRRDRLVRLSTGLDVGSLLGKVTSALSGEIGVQYQRRWSNEPTARHERGYFVPSITLSTKL